MGRVENTAAIMLLCSFIGIIMAIILYGLYEREIVVSALIDQSITLPAVLFLTVFIWELMGVIISARQ